MLRSNFRSKSSPSQTSKVALPHSETLSQRPWGFGQSGAIKASLSKLSIQTQLRGGLAIMLLCAVGIGGAGLYSADQVKRSVGTSNQAQAMLSTTPALLDQLKTFYATGSETAATGAVQEITNLRGQLTDLSVVVPKEAASMKDTLNELDQSFDYLVSNRRDRETAVALLNRLTNDMVEQQQSTVDLISSVAEERSTQVELNLERVNKLLEMPSEISEMYVAAVLVERNTAEFVKADQLFFAHEIKDHLEKLRESADDVYEVVGTEAIQAHIERLTTFSDRLAELIDKQREEGISEIGGSLADQLRFGQATDQILIATTGIRDDTKEPIAQQLQMARQFESTTSSINSLLSQFQSVFHHVAAVRSAYLEYLAYPTSDTVIAFDAALDRVNQNLVELEEKRAEVLGLTSDEELVTLLSGEIAESLVIAKETTPQITATFQAMVTANTALSASNQAVTEAVVSLSQAAKSISATAGTTATNAGQSAQTTIAAALGFGLVLGLVLATVLTRAIVKPLQNLTGSMQRLKDGDTDQNIPAIDRTDQLGDMARAISTFCDRERERMRLEAETRAGEDAMRERQAQVDQLVSGFRGDIKDVLSEVSDNMKELEQTAERLSGIASTTSDRSQEVSSASNEATGSVQTVATAAEELAASITEIGSQVSVTLDRLETVTSATQTSNERIDGLSKAAQRIGDVVALIQDIAEQTNLLALNATIEAARAGEAGRGFAVVASEVKALAEQTAKATQDISGQVQEIQGSTEEVVMAISGIMEMMTDVSSRATAMAGAIEEQSSATSNISSNVSLAADRNAQVAASIQAVAERSGETNASASRVEHVAETATQQINSVTSRIERFLKDVAAA